MNKVTNGNHNPQDDLGCACCGGDDQRSDAARLAAMDAEAERERMAGKFEP